jgi:hypothetical protein
MCQPGWQRRVRQLANKTLAWFLFAPATLPLLPSQPCLSPTTAIAASFGAGNPLKLAPPSSGSSLTIAEPPGSRSTRMRSLDTLAKLPRLYSLSTGRRGRAGHQRCGRGDGGYRRGSRLLLPRVLALLRRAQPSSSAS